MADDERISIFTIPNVMWTIGNNRSHTNIKMSTTNSIRLDYRDNTSKQAVQNVTTTEISRIFQHSFTNQRFLSGSQLNPFYNPLFSHQLFEVEQISIKSKKFLNLAASLTFVWKKKATTLTDEAFHSLIRIWCVQQTEFCDNCDNFDVTIFKIK